MKGSSLSGTLSWPQARVVVSSPPAVVVAVVEVLVVVVDAESVVWEKEKNLKEIQSVIGPFSDNHKQQRKV